MLGKTDVFPIDAKSYNFSILFGLISFSYLLEDRRPDLDPSDLRDKRQIEKLGYKYKHLIKVRFFNKKKSFIIHSINSGTVISY